MAYKVFTNGSVLNASEINDNLMNQAVITFTNSTARASAITSPIEGMVTYLADTNVFEFWNGSAWTALVPTPSAGGILQVVRNSTTTTTNTTSTSMVDVTNMTVTITPTSATSNIYVYAIAQVNPTASTGTNVYGRLEITNSSNTSLSGAGGGMFFGNQRFSYSGGAGGFFVNANLLGFVAAGDTSTRTYKLRASVDSSTTTFSINPFATFTGQMIALEVAA